MKQLGRTSPFIVAALLTLQGLTAMAAQPAKTNNGSAQAAVAAPDRQALVREILDLWANAPNPMVSENKRLYGDLRAALKLATLEQLLEARQGRTYDDVWAALPKGATSESRIVPLAQGQRVPEVIGDTGDDLEFTPVTPCRIIDTRGGVAPYTGVIGPNSGNWFYVAESNYSSQGGYAGSCGIPTNPYPAAVMINVTSTGQGGTGNLRVIQSGGGTPNVSLVNYVAGVNIANAAIVPSYAGSGTQIFIYSGNSTSHAVVDIMGYFSPAVLPPAGRAYAHVDTTPAFLLNKGFSAVSRPSTGIYCLTTAVDFSATPALASVEWGNSSGSDLAVFVRQPSFSCAAGQLEIRTYTMSTATLTNLVSFHVFIP